MRRDFSEMSRPASRAERAAVSSRLWRAPTQPMPMMTLASSTMAPTTTEAMESRMGQSAGQTRLVVRPGGLESPWGAVGGKGFTNPPGG